MVDAINICVIDDEKIVCERLKAILEKNGFNVEAVTVSSEAMKKVTEKNCHILITDIKMDKPDGIDMLRYTRQHAPDTRVIMITGFATVETAREALKSGAVDFIAKPFRMSQIKDIVMRIAEELRNGQKST